MYTCNTTLTKESMDPDLFKFGSYVDGCTTVRWMWAQNSARLCMFYWRIWQQQVDEAFSGGVAGYEECDAGKETEKIMAENFPSLVKEKFYICEVE